MNNPLIENINYIHTTTLGEQRIKNNLGHYDIDVVYWCKLRILDKNSRIERIGKNWYIHATDCIITINASSYTIITCHSL